MLSQTEKGDFESYLLQILPPNLFRFYFFDGEKISDFVFNNNNNSDFKNAFLKLCNLDTMEIIKENFKRLQITRFLDDWGYQANVRQMLKLLDKLELNKQMKIFENKLGISEVHSYNFPWNRLFEVEIEFS